MTELKGTPRQKTASSRFVREKTSSQKQTAKRHQTQAGRYVSSPEAAAPLKEGTQRS